MVNIRLPQQKPSSQQAEVEVRILMFCGSVTGHFYDTRTFANEYKARVLASFICLNA